jgi:hypothetical protein
MRKLTTAPDGVSPFDKEGVALINLGEDATAEELVIEETRLVQEWEDAQYQRERVYPSIGDQLDYIYHNGLTKWKSDMIKPVKDKYPK